MSSRGVVCSELDNGEKSRQKRKKEEIAEAVALALVAWSGKNDAIMPSVGRQTELFLKSLKELTQCQMQSPELNL